MNLNEIIANGGGLLLIAMTLIQISPIKIDPWSHICKCLGRLLNAELIEKIDNVDRKVEQLARKHDAFESTCDEREATQKRTGILMFGDEILHGVLHSKEHHDQILLDCTEYERYCENHPQFSNDVAVQTIALIKRTYQTRMENKSFL